MGRYIYTVKDRITDEVLFVGGETACAEYLDCTPTYVSTMASRELSRKNKARFSDVVVTREFREWDVYCKDCGAKIPGARPNRVRCDTCKNKRKRMQEMRYRDPELPVVLDDNYMTTEEKQRAMQEACHGCVYFGGENYMNATCNYLFIVGHSRGCQPGKECIRRKNRNRV